MVRPEGALTSDEVTPETLRRRSLVSTNRLEVLEWPLNHPRQQEERGHDVNWTATRLVAALKLSETQGYRSRDSLPGSSNLTTVSSFSSW